MLTLLVVLDWRFCNWVGVMSIDCVAGLYYGCDNLFVIYSRSGCVVCILCLFIDFITCYGLCCLFCV